MLKQGSRILLKFFMGIDMYSQFRTQYPMGSLISELLQIHEGKYIVRASVQVGGSTLATGLSAASTIEQAEDQARARALIVVGIEGRPYSTQAHLIPSETAASLDHPRTQFPVPAHSGEFLPLSEAVYASPLEVNWATPAQASAPFPITEQQQLSWFESEMESSALPAPLSSREGIRTKRSPRPATPERDPSRNRSPQIDQSSQSFLASHPEPPVDLSDIIAQTDVELKRLGWSHTQGRRYLENTYNKRSRQLLTDSELIEFLDFLKTQPVSAKPAS